MQALKDPALILSVVDLLAIISITGYGYKRISSLESQNEDFRKIILGMGTRLTEYENKLRQLSEGLQSADQSISLKLKPIMDLSGRLANLEDDVTESQELIEATISALKGKEIEVKLPEPEPAPVQLFRSKKPQAPVSSVPVGRRRLAITPQQAQQVQQQVRNNRNVRFNMQQAQQDEVEYDDDQGGDDVMNEVSSFRNGRQSK